MSVMDNGDVRIHYEELGEGFPVLTFAPGGMRSTIEAWSLRPVGRARGRSPRTTA